MLLKDANFDDQNKKDIVASLRSVVPRPRNRTAEEGGKLAFASCGHAFRVRSEAEAELLWSQSTNQSTGQSTTHFERVGDICTLVPKYGVLWEPKYGVL